MVEAGMKYNIKACSISACCHNRQNSAGNHPESGESLKWMFI